MTDPAPSRAPDIQAVTPARLCHLADQCTTLASHIRDALTALRAAPDAPTRIVSFHLHTAHEHARRAAAEVTATAARLALIRSRSADTCSVDWGCCPNHGNTLTRSGGGARCATPGCDLSWSYDRLGLPCTEPASFRVTSPADPPDSRVLLCTGHATSARKIHGFSVKEGVDLRQLPPNAATPR